jgi:hypothetical protein
VELPVHRLTVQDSPRSGIERNFPGISVALSASKDLSSTLVPPGDSTFTLV